MALLNYGKTFSELVDLNYLKQPDGSENSNKQYLELVFSKDGHIITHGLDYLKNFVSGERGLVPSYTGVDDFGVLSKNGWTKLTTSYLPIYTTGDYTADTILNSLQVHNLILNKINEGFALNDAMLFKGELNLPDGETDDSGKRVLKVPQSGYLAGWTYRITYPGIYAGKYCYNGDLLIANSDYSDSYDDADWFVVHTDILNTTKIGINGIGYIFEADLSVITSSNWDDYSHIYAPTTSGNENDLLVSQGGGSPIWKSPSTITLSSFLFFDTSSLAFSNNTLTLLLGNNTLTATLPEIIGKAFDGATETKDGSIGLVPAPKSDDINKFLKGDGTWATARDIQVAGASIGDKTLNFVPAGSIAIVANPYDLNPSTTDTFDVGFDLYWWNLEDEKFEQ